METKLKSFFKEYKNILAAYNIAHSTMYFDMVTIAPKKGIPARSEMMSILSGEAFDYQMREEHLKKLDELEEQITLLSDNPYMGVEPRYMILRRQGYRVLIVEKNLVLL